MRPIAIGLTLALLAAPALAQGTDATPSASTQQAASTPSTAPAATGETNPRTGRGGAVIRLRGVYGSSIAVRCAEGESTRACADIALTLLDRMTSMGRMAERSDRDMDRRDRDRDRWRDRDRRDRDDD